MKLVLEELQETLELPRFPTRIESFDVSNIQGSDNVAGMVVSENGKMNRTEYRKFRIRTVEGSNDVASMREAVFRRYRRVLDEGKPLPDLIMIDGGKGQLKAASDAMSELDLEAVPMVGVVKPPFRHHDVSHLLVKGREDEPVYLDSHSLILRLLQISRYWRCILVLKDDVNAACGCVFVGFASDSYRGLEGHKQSSGQRIPGGR